MAGLKPGRASQAMWLGATAGAASLAACGVPWLAILRFTLLVAAFLYAGRYLAPRNLEGAAAVATALSLGLAAAAIFWAIAIAVGFPPAVSFVALGGFALAGARPFDGGPPLRLAAPVALAAVGCAMAVAWTQFGNGSTAPGADLVFANTYAREALFHCAIAQEMRHGLVVHLPAGSSLPYHVGYHLLSALTAVATGASMLDVNYRLLPLVLVPGTAIAAAGFVESWGASSFAAAAGATMLFFADDLSWVFGAAGLGGGSPLGSPAWNLLLGAPVLYGLHHNRGFLLGTMVFFPTLFLIARYARDGGRHELLVGSALAATLVHSKISFFVIAVAAIGVACLLSPLRNASLTTGRFLKVGLLTSLFGAPLALGFALARPGGDATRFAVFPVYIGVKSLVRLGIFPDLDTVGSLARTDPGQFVLRWLPVALLLFALGTLGVRAIGVRELAGRARAGHPLALVTSGVVLTALAMGLTLYTPPDRDNIAYFWAPALLVLSVLAGIDLLAATRADGSSLVWIGAAALLALPGTIQFLWVERSVAVDPSLRVSSGVVEAAEYLATHADPGDVVLEPDVSSSVLAALAPVRPVMAWSDWIRNSLGTALIRERVTDVRRFFRDDGSEIRQRILARYHVRWIWAPTALGGQGFPRSSRVLENSAGILWQVAAAANHADP
jgi:hypothetical protein